MKRRLIPLSILLLAILGVGWWYWSSSSSPEETVLTGNIEMTTVDITFPVGGRLLEINPQEGERVDRGSLLGRLDPAQPQALLEQAQARRVSLEARIDEVRARLRFQQASMDSQVAQARAQRAEAEARLRELRTGARDQEIAQAAAVVQEAEAAWQQAEQDRVRFQELFETGDISRRQLEAIQSIASQAKARLDRAKESLQLLKEGPRQERIQAGEAGLDAAEAGLQQALSRHFEIALTEKSLLTLESERAALQADLDRLQAALDDLEAYSPIDGLVMTRNAEPGEVISPTRPVLRLADTASPWIRAYIPESMLGRIQLGESVEVRTDSFPGKTYKGRISFISDEAEFTPKQIQTQEQRVRWVYRIKIQVENPDGELKLNMPCDARLLSLEGKS